MPAGSDLPAADSVSVLLDCILRPPERVVELTVDDTTAAFKETSAASADTFVECGGDDAGGAALAGAFESEGSSERAWEHLETRASSDNKSTNISVRTFRASYPIANNRKRTQFTDRRGGNLLDMLMTTVLATHSKSCGD